MTPVMLLLALGLGPCLLLGGGFTAGWFAKPHPFRNKLVMVGRRPSGGTGVIMAIKPARGLYTYTEKGDYSTDVYLDNAFLWDGAVVDASSRAVTVKRKGTDGKDLTFTPMNLDSAFKWDDRKNSCKFVEVDLDSGHPIRYIGSCKNDDEAVEVTRKDGTIVKLKQLWMRLSGERLYAIRKDIRLKQLAAIGGQLWDFLTKTMPIALVVIGLLMLGIFIVLGVSVAK